MKNNLPLVSLIISCWNQEKLISKCLESIITQDYSKDRLEFLVMEGMSEDGTRRIVKRYEDKCPFARLVDNSKYASPAALNSGIEFS